MAIIVTRPSPSGEQLVAQLAACGRVAIHLPLIQIEQGKQCDTAIKHLSQLGDNDLVFVLSQHAVSHLASTLQKKDQPWPKAPHYYAIGQRSAETFHGASTLTAQYPAAPEISENLLALDSLNNISGKTALLLRGNGGRELIKETLELRGAKVYCYECYQRQPCHYDEETLRQIFSNTEISQIVITSGEMLIQFNEMMIKHDKMMLATWQQHSKLFVVSERLALLASTLGWQKIDVTDSADNSTLVDALCSI